MGSTIVGDTTLQAQSLAVVVSRFNSMVTEKLLAGAEEVFFEQGGSAERLTTVWVPGSFELPATVKRLADTGKFDGLLALGALIKGSTLHFEVLAHQVTRALVELSVVLPMPLAFGVLTTLDIEQALERAGPRASNKGAEAMQSLIEMVSLHAKIT